MQSVGYFNYPLFVLPFLETDDFRAFGVVKLDEFDAVFVILGLDVGVLGLFDRLFFFGTK